jgi:site-specific DNA-methyltransferase (adenine-specific)
MGRVSCRWVIATTAFEHAARMYDDPPQGLRPIRVGAWVKTNPMPQITGDRPTQGWEAVSIQYADTCRPHWNGGGRPATYIGPSADDTEYPTQKPEWLISRFIADFCDDGESILDPFSGGGTTLVCAWRAGHPVIGCDIREEACEISAQRLEREMAQGRIDLPRRTKAKQVSFL